MAKFRDRVQLMRPQFGTDDYGNPAQGHTPASTIWADVIERLGGEKLAAGRIENTRQAAVTVWARDLPEGFCESWRITSRGFEWSILSIATAGRSGALVEISISHGGPP